MADVRPFPSLRPNPDFAVRICELPYDVFSVEEARAKAAGNPHSFLRVSRAEIDLDPSVDPHDPRVYVKARENLQRLVRDRLLSMDNQPCFYLYRQVMDNHTQIGLAAVVGCEDYESRVVKRHELTRPEKEDDRTCHIEALDAQTGPVFLLYRASPRIDQLLLSKMSGRPSVDFTSEDGIRHTSWILQSPTDISFLQQEFGKMTALYIADGHHRCAAAVRLWKKRLQGALDPAVAAQSSRTAGFFLAVIFPHNQCQVLPYNRLVRDLRGLGLDRFVHRMRELGLFEVHAQRQPARKHEICVFLDGVWRLFRWRKDLVEGEDPVGQLDVSLLQKHVLAPLLGIEDPRTSDRINFVGGIRGVEELEKPVRNGAYAVAFSMFPTSVEELMTVADSDGILPPKSTWFEPKLRDGMFCYALES